MKSPNGSVNVSITLNGKTLLPTPQGYLGQGVNAGDIFEIEIALSQPESGKRYLVTSNRMRENVALLQEGAGNVFRHSMTVIQKDRDAKFDRDDPDRNCVHIVEMNEQGIVSVINIILTAQEESFFLIFDPTFVAQAYNNVGKVAVPTLRIEPGFPCLIPMIESHYEKSVMTLPAYSTYVTPPEIKPDVAEALKLVTDSSHLVVAFWSARVGTGMAYRKLKNGQFEKVKLEYRKILVPERFPRHLLATETISARAVVPFHQGRIRQQALDIRRVEFEAAAAS